MAGPTLPVDQPTREPRIGGLSSVAQYRPNERLGIAGGLRFVSGGCAFPHTEELRCYDDTVADKTYDGIELEDGIGAPMTLFAGSNCTLGPIDDHEARARATVEEGRDRVIEPIIATWAAGGTALTAGATARIALARVDQAIDANYRGRGVILMSRFDAEDAGLKVDGTKLTTKLGTPVVASGMIAPGVVYGLGAIAVEISELNTLRAPHPTTNQDYAIAEQVFAVVVDCSFRVKSAITAP